MSTNRKILGSEIFCESIAAEGVEVMFGIPGGVVLPLYDKINKFGHKIKHILPRHEQGGAFAAEGYARSTGRTGLCLGTSGPGATNLITAMANSMMDSIPVIYITGQVVEDLIGTDAFQETDLMGMTMPIVKHSYFVKDASDISRVMKEAFHIANTGRPGPVHVDITKDAWLSEAEYDATPEMDLPGYKPYPEPCSDEAIKKLDQLLADPDLKPVIIAGHGVEQAKGQKELIEFSEKHNIPVVSTLLNLGNFPQGHENWAGMIGMHGDAVANYAIHDSNLIIGIGCRFDDRITGKLSSFKEGKKFVHMEIDVSEIGKIVPTELPLPGDLKDTLTRANKLLQDHTYPAWAEQISTWKKEHGFLDFKYAIEKNSGKMNQSRIVTMLSEMTDGNAILAADVGRHHMWVGRFYRFKNPNSHLSSGGLGSMGIGLYKV